MPDDEIPFERPEGSHRDTLIGIAEHLAREQGKSVREVWPEAVSLMRNVYVGEQYGLPPREHEEKPRQR